MRFVIFTHDLTEYNSHLMPWRVVIEVVNYAKKMGHGARLVSLGDRQGRISGEGIPEDTVLVDKTKSSLFYDLRQLIEDWRSDAILWPLVWRESRQRVNLASMSNAPVIGYMPGGVYCFSDVLYAVRAIGVKKTQPYLAEAVWPKRLRLANWRKAGIKHLITMSEYTTGTVISGKWSSLHVSTLLPGREKLEDYRPELDADFEFLSWIDGRPYFLFAGPPAGIRGIYELLRAFEIVASTQEDVCLVCLFRSDGDLESENISRYIESLTCRDRVFSVWKSVTKKRLEAFMSECRSIVLPFVVVPSEIPLAIIEAMKFGRPVITTMTGGTGDFVSKFGVALQLGDIDGLASVMVKFLVDDKYYSNRCKATEQAYRMHPDWSEMAEGWLKCISSTLESKA